MLGLLFDGCSRGIQGVNNIDVGGNWLDICWLGLVGSLVQGIKLHPLWPGKMEGLLGI